jgi:ABC-2 type transport system ATP-binding protein
METILPPVLAVDHLTKIFGNIKAVKDVSITINESEIYALIGPNGAGKTTVVKMITGLLPPSQGTITIVGINALTDAVRAKRMLGYIPDEPFAYQYLSGREFLEFTGTLQGLSRETAKKRIKELANMYDIDELLDGHFDDFSRGNKQKTVIISALLHRPKLLLIDEPIVGLDTQSQQITKALLTEFAKNRGAVLLCTHTLPVAQAIATRIGVLYHGQLIHEGTIKELKKTAEVKNADLEEIYLKLTND